MVIFIGIDIDGTSAVAEKKGTDVDFLLDWI